MAMQVSNNTVVANGQSTTSLPDLSPAYVAFKVLVRALPYMVTEKFGQTFVLPEKSTRTAKFRRWEALNGTPVQLTEGVTPASQDLTFTDMSVTLNQYGNLITMSDVLLDTSDGSVLENTLAVVGEQAAEVIERLRLGVMFGGSNVEFANGTARTNVNTPINLGLQRRITRKLKNQRARHIAEFVSSTPNFNTESVAPGFVAICHPDVESDIRDMVHFIDAKDYNGRQENEIGSVEGVRYFFTTLAPIYPDAGGNKGTGPLEVLSTSGTMADVYPVLYIAKDAYGLIPFKGANAVTPSVVPAAPSASDPLGQRTHVGWKTMQAAVILNQAWMVRAEVACLKK